MKIKEKNKIMLEFKVDIKKCIVCGKCAEDCPSRIIKMETGRPQIADDKQDSCLKCQHCLAICPPGAISILGKNPENSQAIAGKTIDAKQLELLMRGRRSVRRYVDENVDAETITRLLDTAANAPTGVNSRQVRFTVVDDRLVMQKVRVATMKGLSAIVKKGKLPEELEFFAGFVKNWEEKGIDIVFRGAPHMIIASAPADCPTPEADCIIALSYFELFAQSLGLGTVWNGIAKWAITVLVPEMQAALGIPAGHQIGYIMVFGKPAVKYMRTVQRTADNVTKVKM